MADDTKTPPVKGEPDTPADEASARRAAQEAREATAAFDPASGNVNGSGESLADRAAAAGDAPATEEEDDGQQTFVVEKGRRVTLSTLYKRGTSVKYEFKLGSKSVPGSGDMGLLPFGEEIMLVISAVPGKVEVDPTYDGDGNVKSVTIRANVKPRSVYDAHSEAGQVALRGE